MSRIKYVFSIFLLSLSSFAAVVGQDKPNNLQSPAPLVTADGSGDRVRITAPASVVQMRIEVYSNTGEKLFENEVRVGNVFDWNLQNGLGQPLPTGDYICVVTMKNAGGELSQRVGSVTVADKNISLGQAKPSPLQTQVIGPLAEDSSWTIVDMQTNQTTTVIAHDGRDGQIIRGQGALSFRLGDFFSGQDREQMRLTEEGNLGLGTDQPQSKLDIAGDIRASGVLHASKGIEFSDGTVQTTGLSGRKDKDGNIVPNASGAGTQGRLAKWLDNAGTLGDSVALDTGTGLQLTAAASNQVDTNVLFTAGRDRTAGIIASNVAAFTSPNGPFFALRGNTYSAIPGQRGNFVLAAGNVSSPGPLEGVVKLNTGNDQLRMLITATGNVGVGNSNPQSLFDVAGDVNTSTQFKIGGNSVLSVPGNQNLFVGVPAGANNTGSFNSFIGRGVGVQNTTGSSNSFVGVNAGGSNTTGSANTFLGAGSGGANTTGGSNTFVGAGAGLNTTTGNDNAFFGTNAGRFNSTGGSNAFFGEDAGFSTTVGGSNSFFGTEAGTNNTSGFDDAFFGKDAGFQNTGGLFNSFFGASAGQNNTTGTENAFFGEVAGFSTTTGNSNSFFGQNSGHNNSTGNSNVFVGSASGSSITTENNNTFLGTSSDGAAGIANATAIGANAQVTQSNSLVLGSINGVNGAIADTRVGIGTTAPARHLHVFGASDQEIGIESSDTNGRQWTLQASRGTANGRFEIIDRTANANRFTILSNGNVGIGGVTGPGAKLQVGNGDVAITTQGNGLILHATNGGNCFLVTVDDAGVLSTTHVLCP